MKCKKFTFYDLEGQNFISPKIIFGKLLSEDDNFISFLSGRGRSYKINKNHIISVEDSDKEFELQEDV